MDVSYLSSLIVVCYTLMKLWTFGNCVFLGKGQNQLFANNFFFLLNKLELYHVICVCVCACMMAWFQYCFPFCYYYWFGSKFLILIECRFQFWNCLIFFFCVSKSMNLFLNVDQILYLIWQTFLALSLYVLYPRFW